MHRNRSGFAMTRQEIFDAITVERRRQDEKWGIQAHLPGMWLAILVEEVGEAATALLESGDGPEWRKELIQIAAVAVATIEARELAGSDEVTDADDG